MVNIVQGGRIDKIDIFLVSRTAFGVLLCDKIVRWTSPPGSRNVHEAEPDERLPWPKP